MEISSNNIMNGSMETEYKKTLPVNQEGYN
jgi:hypothetical protein